MAKEVHNRTRLCLVTPPDFGDRFPDILDRALAGGDVASVIIVPPKAMPEHLAKRIGTVAARHDVAAVVAGDTMPLTGLDGVHIEGGLDSVRSALKHHHAKHIVGAGGVFSRHDAMTIGEAGPDYIFFGRLDGDGQPRIHPGALALAEWWVPLFEIPAIVMGGRAVESVEDAARRDIEFVALRSAVWDHPDGPQLAVAAANRILAAAEAEPVQ